MATKSSGTKKAARRGTPPPDPSIAADRSARQEPLRDARFDPWTSTRAGAQTFGNEVHSALPLEQYRAAQEVLALGAAVERGDGASVLFAVVKCAEAGLLMPEWLASAFLSRYDEVMSAKARSWDDVFGHPWPPGTRLHDERRQLELALPIVRAIEHAAANGRSVNAALFAAVGREVGQSASYVRDAYYEMRERLSWVRTWAVVEAARDVDTRIAKTSTKRRKSA